MWLWGPREKAWAWLGDHDVTTERNFDKTAGQRFIAGNAYQTCELVTEKRAELNKNIHIAKDFHND